MYVLRKTVENRAKEVRMGKDWRAMSNDLQKEIARLREVCDAASDGPWTAYENGPWGSQGFGVVTFCDDKVHRAFNTHPHDNSKESAKDALFIAESRTALPKLLDALEVALEELGVIEKSDSNIPAHIIARSALKEIETIIKGGE